MGVAGRLVDAPGPRGVERRQTQRHRVVHRRRAARRIGRDVALGEHADDARLIAERDRISDGQRAAIDLHRDRGHRGGIAAAIGRQGELRPGGLAEREHPDRGGCGRRLTADRHRAAAPGLHEAPSEVKGLLAPTQIDMGSDEICWM